VSVPHPAATDPLHLDTDQLYSLTAEKAVHAGLDDFKSKRVTRVVREKELLWAEVEDAGSGELLTVEVSRDADGTLLVACPCERGEALCRHAVAALFAWRAKADGEPPLLGAVEGAIEERRQRGRTEVRLQKLDGEPWFGTWRARSVSKETHFPRHYTVHIRSLERRANFCTCPDFETNQLGTCKHIEAVLHKVARRRDFKALRGRPAPLPYIFLDWEAEEAPRVRLHRSGTIPTDLAEVLAGAFDGTGDFRGRVPDDLFLLADRLDGREDIHLGEDVLAHARRLAAAASQRARAAEIRGLVNAAGGHLPGIRARLYPYQVEGVAFLAGNGRALLADDMGLGKTLQAITAAIWLHTHAGAERILVVCPASLKQQWAREIARFTGLDAHVVQGPAAARHRQYHQGSGFYIINYELALRDLSELAGVLAPDLLILDEAQRIKNWRTKLAAAVKRIPSRYAFVLSGTPLENRLEDLYSLMQVVDPHVLGPLWRYLVDFHVTDERGKVLGYRNLSELRRRLTPVMLRRDRRLVRDQLPERIEQRLDVLLTPAQRGLHDSALASAAALAQIARRRPLTPGEQNRLMASLQQARMACDAAGLVDKTSEGSPKLDELVALMEELCVEGGLKAVVFSQWERMTAMAEERLHAIGLGCVRLHGGVPGAKRGDLIDRFHNDESVRVFISTDAGSTGLNLQNASVMVNLDVPWNPAVLEQRIARVHRLGQTTRVQSILMVAAESYEERVLGLVQNKRDLFDNVVDGEATAEVVGVSRRLMETLVEDLGAAPDTEPKVAPQVEAAESLDVGSEPPATESAPPAPVTGHAEPQGDAAALSAALERIQAAFGPRIERVLGTGGGLLVVLDRVDDAAEAVAAGMEGAIPVALIDSRTLGSLQRLGAVSPLAEAQIHFAAAQPAEPAGTRQQRLARERLDAARVLAHQNASGPALELMVSALLAAAAARAGTERVPAAHEAALWLYAEALPRGWIDATQAALITGAIGLAQAPSLPGPLLEKLFDDAGIFIDAVPLVEVSSTAANEGAERA